MKRWLFTILSAPSLVMGVVTGVLLIANVGHSFNVLKRQVPPSGATDGKWMTIIDDMNPNHDHYPVQKLRVDPYAYLSPGVVEFDDVQLKAVGVRKN